MQANVDRPHRGLHRRRRLRGRHRQAAGQRRRRHRRRFRLGEPDRRRHRRGRARQHRRPPTGPSQVEAANDASIIAVAGAIAFSLAVSGKGTAAAVAIGAAFAINFLHGTGSDANTTTAEIVDSGVAAFGDIDVEADTTATIFALAIGAAASVAGSNTGLAVAFSLAGSLGWNEIRNVTQARALDAAR